MNSEKNLVEMFEKVGIKLDMGQETPEKLKAETNDVLVDANNDNLDVETNANEIMHITNTGYGKELVPLAVLAQEIYDAVPKYGQFLGSLPGYHGNNMAYTEKVPIIGDVGYFQGNTEPTTGAMAIAQGTNLQPTAEITITQAELILSIDVSRRLLTYSVADLQSLLVQKIAAAAAQTAEGMIINGDAETGATGNVNSDDQAPATTYASVGGASHYSLLLDHGLRELAINGTNLTENVGTLAIDDFLAIMANMGQYASTPADNMWLFNAATYTKMLGITELLSMATNGKQSTIWGGALTNIFGSDLVVHKSMYKTEADGKLSKTSSNNTLGQIVYFRKPAVQWGYGRPIEFDIFKVPGKGVQICATFEFGFYIVQEAAGVTDSSVSAGINITV